MKALKALVRNITHITSVPLTSSRYDVIKMEAAKNPFSVSFLTLSESGRVWYQMKALKTLVKDITQITLVPLTNSIYDVIKIAEPKKEPIFSLISDIVVKWSCMVS